MPTKKPKAQKLHAAADNLVVVAHPDDEAIFFSGLILSQKKCRWHIVCVTDGNADDQGTLRAGQFEKASRILKSTRHEMWNFPDIFEKRLDVNELTDRLKTLPKYKRVFTHGILGEYGHAHHQDVSFAVHTAFKDRAPVYSVAYNVFPDLKIALTASQYGLKTKLLWEIYGSEIKRFVNLIPATSIEGFTRVSFEEVVSLYSALAGERPLLTKALKKYKWLAEWIDSGGGRLATRPF